MQKKLDREEAQLAKMKLPPEFRKILEANGGDCSTSTDMGIRLLAYDLKQTRQLYLWWD